MKLLGKIKSSLCFNESNQVVMDEAQKGCGFGGRSLTKQVMVPGLLYVCPQ